MGGSFFFQGNSYGGGLFFRVLIFQVSFAIFFAPKFIYVVTDIAMIYP